MHFNRKSEDTLDIKYVDGKPVKVKNDPVKEIKKELKAEEPVNFADDVKRALYADQPKAKQKMDRSITARDLNQTVESFNKRRNEVKSLNESNTETFTFKNWSFIWDKVAGTLKTNKKPDNGYNLEYKSPKLKNDDKKTATFVHLLMIEHMNRVKS